MFRAQAVVAFGGLNGIGHVAHLALVEAAVFVRAHAQAIEDGGDAGGDDLRVMGLDGRGHVPAHAGAGRVMGLQVVGVQLDEAWNK